MPVLDEHLRNLPQVGALEWIGLSPGRRGALQVVREARVDPTSGLEGDYHSGGARGQRQVTLVQREHLAVLGALLGRDPVLPEELRRNLVVSGINLRALESRGFRVGDVVLEGTGDCDPCSFLEESLGEGGLNAALGHAGITTRVLRGGTLRVGDVVEVVPE